MALAKKKKKTQKTGPRRKERAVK